MAPTIDSETLLYVLGVVFALGTLAFFASNVAFDLSITVTAALLLVAFVALLITGLAIDREPLDTVAFAVAGLAYVVFLGYIASQYNPAASTVFVLLAASAGLFVGLGYALQENRLTVDRRTARLALLGLAAAGILLIGADSIGELETTIELDDEVELHGSTPAEEPVVYGDQRIGTLTIRNPTLFTRPIDVPPLEGCLAGTDDRRRTSVDVSYEPRRYQLADRLRRDETVTATLRLQFDLPANATVAGQRVPIERADSCAVTRSEPTLLVVDNSQREAASATASDRPDR
jgi:hypothetical protein